ncbi:hypothetical protein NHJ6243_001959 [Beauveria neobassiana]
MALIHAQMEFISGAIVATRSVFIIQHNRSGLVRPATVLQLSMHMLREPTK